MNVPAIKQTEQEPDVFLGTGFLVEEIVLGLNILNRKVRDLQQGNGAQSAVQQKLMAEDVAKVAGQIKNMADTVARVTIAHINRRPRP